MPLSQSILLVLVLAMLPLSLLELALSAMMWPPYMRAVLRPWEGTPLEGAAVVDLSALADAPGGTLCLRGDGDGLLFRRRFGFGKGRAMFMGRLGRGPDGRLSLWMASLPAKGWISISVAFGSFFGLTFGGGSLLVALVAGGLSALLMRANQRSDRQCFVDVGLPALRTLLMPRP